MDGGEEQKMGMTTPRSKATISAQKPVRKSNFLSSFSRDAYCVPDFAKMTLNSTKNASQLLSNLLSSLEIQELPLFNIQEALEKEDHTDDEKLRKQPSSFLAQSPNI